MWNQTKAARRLSVQYPVIQAGMAGGVTTPELVSAVSNAGGLGMIGAGYMGKNELETAIRAVQAQTEKPFGVNLFVPETPQATDAELEKANELLNPVREKLGLKKKNIKPAASDPVFYEQIALIERYKVPVCSFTFGIPPQSVIEQLKSRGILLIGTATTVKEALLNEEAGMDLVVAQGSEAGGHRGSFAGDFEHAMIGLMALVPQMADAVQIPVIAAGGIMDGRGILASLVLGAGAVQMGSAFLTTVESGANRLHKQAVLSAAEDQVVVTSSFSGKPARGIENDFIIEMRKHEQALPAYPIQNKLTQEIRKAAGQQENPGYLAMWSGQNPRLSRDLSAGELIRELAGQVEQLMGSHSDMVL
ncbi:NAD(P)H-dependent flavin oxidoreductase [Heyndrickxia acidiproducens]|uniref:NAD(P)H-dependent flavin oxidoreductase n=1 Tax=Heyndrickxia acidiproducens TaxID=1121084 RepID=UPI0003605D13|nr:nitronate monooxygenase [Heyndrickxia acidiproducens]